MHLILLNFSVRRHKKQISSSMSRRHIGGLEVYLRSFLTSAPFTGQKESNLSTGLGRPWNFQDAAAPRFQDNQHTKEVRLSVLPTGRIYRPGYISGTNFC